MIEGVEKVGEVAAALMDAIDAHLHDCGGGVVNVVIAAEIDRHDGDDVYVQMIAKSSTDSPVYQRGLLVAAIEVVGSGTYSSEDGSGEVGGD
jgi:hypothetical protein